MVIFSNNQPPQQDDSNEQQQSASGGAMSGGGPTVPTPTGNINVPQQKQNQGSGRFTNLQKYLGANQNAGQQIAGGIQQKAEKNVGQIAQNIQNSQNQFQNTAQGFQTNLGQQGQQQVQQGFQDPNAILSDQQKLAEFRRLQQGYGSELSGLNSNAQRQQQMLAQQAQGLGQTADLAGSQAGRYELLRQTYAQPNYTQGQQRLDQLFLQAQPGAGRELQANLQGNVTNVNNQLSGFDSNRQAQLDALNTLSRDRQQQWSNLLTGGSGEGIETDLNQRGLGDIEGGVNSALATANANEAAQKDLVARLGKGSVTSTDLSNIGLSTDFFAPTNFGKTANNIYNLDLSKYIRNTQLQPTAAQVANPEEFARYNQLRELGGQQVTNPNIFGSAAEAGGYTPFDFNKDKFQTDLSKAASTYKANSAYLNKGNASKDFERLAQLRGGSTDGNRSWYDSPDEIVAALNRNTNGYANLSDKDSIAKTLAYYTPGQGTMQNNDSSREQYKVLKRLADQLTSYRNLQGDRGLKVK